jgi:hypothetical protein
MAESIVIEDVQQDIRRVQEFKPENLIQKERLGEMAFEDSVEPARRMIDLFSRVPPEAITEFPFQQKKLLQEQAKATYALFDQILNFKVSSGDPEANRQQLIEQLVLAHQPLFNQLFPLISYLVSRTVDFNSLEARGRAAIQAINDDKEKVLRSINETSEQAAKILQEVREAAAEQGVTQMAKYFGDEADEHKNAAGKWLVASVLAALVVGLYALATLFLYQWFSTENSFESAQIITSKLLVFGVLLYGLFQCVRSYSAHRHNQVTNKHRQNALMTYKTLAEAGNSPELRDAVLQHAAAAIYAPNDSGYLKSEERGYGAQSLLALLPRNPSSTSGSGLP